MLRIFLRAVETTLRNACLHAPAKARFGAVSFITQPVLIDRILTHLDEPVETPTVAPVREGSLCLLATNRGRGLPVPITETPIQHSDW
ncbi:hypothetical protein ACFLU6_03800 [Acidobacteriota bacterium]